MSPTEFSHAVVRVGHKVKALGYRPPDGTACAVQVDEPVTEVLAAGVNLWLAAVGAPYLRVLPAPLWARRA